MLIEEKLPDSFKRNSFHPSVFVYAFRRSVLEKLFDELMSSNIAIKSGEAWLIEGKEVSRLIQLKDGSIDFFAWKIEPQVGEELFDFSERSAKESLAKIIQWDLEKNVRIDISNKIWYHFEFSDMV